MISHTQKPSELVQEIMRIVRGPGIKKRIKEFEELPIINVGNDGVIMNPEWQDSICDNLGGQSDR